MKNLIILIASVEYPSSNNFYLRANSFLLENTQDELQKAADSFKDEIETEDFKITNFLVYVVPKEHYGKVAE